MNEKWAEEMSESILSKIPALFLWLRKFHQPSEVHKQKERFRPTRQRLPERFRDKSCS